MKNFRTVLPALLLPLLAACGDDPALELENRADLELFTEIHEVVGGVTRYRQRATVILSPSLSEQDVELITRVRIIDAFEQDWVLSEGSGFEAGLRGWELEAERAASRPFRTGPWNLRMVVEKQGVFEMGHLQQTSAVAAPFLSETSLVDDVVTVRWGPPSQAHDWTIQLIQRDEDGEDTLLDQLVGQAGGGGVITARFDVEPETYEDPNRLLYRFVLVNSVSRRTTEGLLEPGS